MNAEAQRADRHAAVRKAAQGWHKAGVIDDAALKAVEAAYPDDRSRMGPVFRALLFFFTLVSINGAFGFVLALMGNIDKAIGPLLVIFGVALTFGTDLLLGPMRMRQNGIESALSLTALGFLISGCGWMLFDQIDIPDQVGVPVLFLISAVMLALAAWRWGYPVYAAAATGAILGAVAAIPLGRLLWIALPLLAAPWLARLSDAERLPPSHRASFTGALGMGLVAAYLAVHFGTLKAGLVEMIGARWSYRPAIGLDTLWWLSLAGMILLPALYLAVGLRTRRLTFLLVGLGAAIATIITLCYYTGLEPLWAVLTVSGILLTGLILGLRRYLEAGAGGERHGFTAAPLFEDLARQRLLEAGAAAVTFTPGARPVPDEPKFAGGGGEFGGGGSTADF